PENPEIDLPAGEKSVDELVDLCLIDLKQRGVIR
ncbi:adenylyl-sulfate kinase, partial [Vibrio parahaemolyticus]|nr:adenylyl-sulfate kinase [Vibrio parahaemolyticus]